MRQAKGRKEGVIPVLTEFGKALRKIRIDRQELLKDMAEALGVSSAYLSAVETGKRRIPTGWVKEIQTKYVLGEDECRGLEQAADCSVTDVTIQLDGASQAKRNAVLSFAKAIDGLSDEELTKIMCAMKKNKGRCNKERV